MAKRKESPKNPVKAETPLAAKQKAIADQEAKLQAQMERYQRLIEEAPKLAKERERKRREQFVTRAARTEQRGRPRAALPDRRYELNAPAVERYRRLRSERNEGRTMFFILILAFGGVVAWLYFAYFHGAS